MSHKQHHPIIYFDGVCNLCNGAVQFALKRDTKGVFRFAALQSDAGQHILDRVGLPREALKTIVLVEGDTIYTHSTAALRAARHLSGLWPLLYAFIVVPRPIRDGVYNWIARNRYRWFGRTEACMMPRPEWKGRFL